MPYHNLGQLPESVKNSLPKHGQEIYQEAFNSAWDTYKDPENRQGSEDRETTAHKVAWSAVKSSYKKKGEGQWVKKNNR